MVVPNDQSDTTEKKKYDAENLSIPLKATEWKQVSSVKNDVTPSDFNNSENSQRQGQADWNNSTPKKSPPAKKESSRTSQKIKELEARIIKLQNENLSFKKSRAANKLQSEPEYFENRIAYRSSESINKTISPVLGKVMQEFYKLNSVNESLNGNVVLSFKIKNTGELFWLKISYKTIENKVFLDYVLNEFKKCKFEPVDPKSKPVSMIYPLIFKPLED